MRERSTLLPLHECFRGSEDVDEISPETCLHFSIGHKSPRILWMISMVKNTKKAFSTASESKPKSQLNLLLRYPIPSQCNHLEITTPSTTAQSAPHSQPLGFSRRHTSDPPVVPQHSMSQRKADHRSPFKFM